MRALLLGLLVLTLPQGPVETLVLKNGEHVRAEVLRLDGDRVVLRVMIEGGSMQVNRGMDEFQPQSAYRIFRQTRKLDSIDEQLRLAEFAADHGLVWVAQRDLESARKLKGDAALAPELAKKIEEKGASILESLLRKELTAGDVQKARRLMSELLIRYPDSSAAQKQTELFALLDKEEQRLAEAKRAAEAARIVAKLDQARAQAIRPIEKHIDDGVAENREVLLTSKHFAVAHGHFEAANSHFQSALKRIGTAAKSFSNDGAFTEELDQVRQRATTLQMDALMNAASVCLVRGQFAKALGHVNSVLAIDPGNGDARAMRARIEVAANKRGGYGGTSY